MTAFTNDVDHLLFLNIILEADYRFHKAVYSHTLRFFYVHLIADLLRSMSVYARIMNIDR